jgi:hypothetical protein
MIDDYGYWRARHAANEFFATVERVLLRRIDSTGRLVLNPGDSAH